MAPKALSTIMSRASTAREENRATVAALRGVMVSQTKEAAREAARGKLDTETADEDWEPVTTFPGIPVAMVLEVSPGVKLAVPRGTNDVLLMVGNDPAKWPTVRDLPHLGQLIDERGL